jgi:hypothetical protein
MVDELRLNLAIEFASFIDHYRSKGSVFKDWNQFQHCRFRITPARSNR